MEEFLFISLGIISFAIHFSKFMEEYKKYIIELSYIPGMLFSIISIIFYLTHKP